MKRESARRNEIEYAAALSDCDIYRYWLTRIWDASKLRMIFVMLNPSTADHRIDDPTIRRCMAFALREGYGGIEVRNLFAYRTSSPLELKQKHEAGVDVVGPENDDALAVIQAVAEDSSCVVAAWGNNGTIGERAAQVIAGPLSTVDLQCLGVTQAEQPCHPLYMPADTELVTYRAKAQNP